MISLTYILSDRRAMLNEYTIYAGYAYIFRVAVKITRSAPVANKMLLFHSTRCAFYQILYKTRNVGRIFGFNIYILMTFISGLNDYQLNELRK